MRKWINLFEGEVVSLAQHKTQKAAGEYASAIGDIIAGESAFFHDGKFLPFADTYIASGFKAEFKPQIMMDVSIRSMADFKRNPDLKEFVKELKARKFKVQVTKYHRDSVMTDEQKQGPWGRKENLTIDDLRQIWANRENSPFGEYQESRSGFRTSHKDTYDARGVGFNIAVGGMDSRRGDKYGNANREEYHIIDNDADFKEVMDMFALIQRAKMKSV